MSICFRVNDNNLRHTLHRDIRQKYISTIKKHIHSKQQRIEQS
jgi:hypothetical protein